jgi:WD40 repeat protein
VAFSPDGMLIASGHFGGSVCIWDASTGAQRHNFKEHSRQVVSVAFSPNSKLIASASEDKAIRVWNVITGIKLRTYQRTHRIRSVRFLPDNKRIIFNKPLGSIWSWDFMDNEELWVSHPPDDQSYHHGYREITVSADGKLVICGDRANRKRVWFLNTETGQSMYDAKIFERDINCIAFSPDNEVLAVAFDKKIELCNISTGATQQIVANNHPKEIIFSTDGKFIAIATFNAIDIRDMNSQKKWCEIRDPHLRHTGGPERFAFSPDGAIVASVGASNGIALWDTRFSTKQSAPTFDGRHSSVLAVSFDDNQIASGSFGDALWLWDGQTGARDQLCASQFRPYIDIVSHTFKLGIFKYHFPLLSVSHPPFYIREQSNIASITFSPNSKFLACVWKTKILQVWNTQARKLLFSRILTSSTSDDVVFSPNGTLVASLSNKIHFWDTSTGAELYASKSPSVQVKAIAFSPDGRFFVSSISTDYKTIEPSVCDGGDFYGYTHIIVYVEYENHLRFSSDSKLLAYRFRNNVMLLDVETRVFLHAFSPYGWVNLRKLAFTRDNKFLVAMYAGSNICIWDVVKGEIIHEVDLKKVDQGLCFSLNGRHIASLDKVLGYRSRAISNCHSPGISLAEGWIKDDGQDIIYFPQDCRDIFDFLAGSSLVFSWPRAGFMREVVQHSGCNVLQLAMGEKVMDERPSGLTSDSVIYSRIAWMLTLWPTCLFVVFVVFLSMYIGSEKQAL